MIVDRSNHPTTAPSELTLEEELEEFLQQEFEDFGKSFDGFEHSLAHYGPPSPPRVAPEDRGTLPGDGYP